MNIAYWDVLFAWYVSGRDIRAQLNVVDQNCVGISNQEIQGEVRCSIDLIPHLVFGMRAKDATETGDDVLLLASPSSARFGMMGAEQAVITELPSLVLCRRGALGMELDVCSLEPAHRLADDPLLLLLKSKLPRRAGRRRIGQPAALS